RRALPEPEEAAAARAGGRLPSGPVEELLAGIWSDLLGIPEVGAEESFFNLGGHSLLATRLVSRVRRAFGGELPVKALFAAPTVAGLAHRIEALRAGGEAAAPLAPPLRPVPRPPEGAPLSFAQERLWFLDQLAPGAPTYNVPGALDFHGELAVDA